MYSFSYPGVYIITATFTIDYMTNVAAQGLFYALSTSSTGWDANASTSMYFISQGSAAGIKTTLNVQRAIYISSTSTSVYLIAYSALSASVFYISNETPSSITSIRIG